MNRDKFASGHCHGPSRPLLAGTRRTRTSLYTVFGRPDVPRTNSHVCESVPATKKGSADSLASFYHRPGCFPWLPTLLAWSYCNRLPASVHLGLLLIGSISDLVRSRASLQSENRTRNSCQYATAACRATALSVQLKSESLVAPFINKTRRAQEEQLCA